MSHELFETKIGRNNFETAMLNPLDTFFLIDIKIQSLKVLLRTIKYVKNLHVKGERAAKWQKLSIIIWMTPNPCLLSILEEWWKWKK